MKANCKIVSWQNIAILIFLVSIIACSKDEGLKVHNEPDFVTDAEINFVKGGEILSVDTAGASYRYRKEGKPQWEKAKLRKKGDTTIIFVPIIPKEEFYTVNDEGDLVDTLMPQLRAMKYSEEPWSFSLLMYISEKVVSEEIAGFTGTVLVNDWFEGTASYVHLYGGTPQLKHTQGNIHKQMGWWETICYGKMVYGCVNGVCKLYQASGNTCITVYIEGEEGQGPAPEEYDPPAGGPPNNPPAPPPTKAWDINDQIGDLCLSQTINKALNQSETVMGVITDIIRELDGDKSVTINVKSGTTNSGKPGETQAPTVTWVNGVPSQFTTTVMFDNSYIQDVSQEGTIAIFIHEILHAYISKSALIGRNQNIDHHQYMAETYVEPMAEFLLQLFDISELDAFSLAWGGLFYSGGFNDVSSFHIAGADYSKTDIIQASAKFMGRDTSGNMLRGTEQCSE